VSKITKAFLDALYAFLDGLVLLASDESPVITGKQPPLAVIKFNEPNTLDLLDVTDGVCENSTLGIAGKIANAHPGYQDATGDI
jgi:hypothetical protein